MRITSQMSQANNLYRLTSNYSKVSNLTEQITAERQVLKVSDNPTAAVNGIKVLSSISKTEQYIRNIISGSGTLAMADSQLGSVKGVMDEIKSLVVGASSDSTTAEGRQAMAIELKEMLSQLLITANAHDGERYIFGGTNTASEPFTTVGGYVLYNGNNQSINVQTGQNSTTAINCTGTDAFGNMTTSIGTGDLNPGVNLCTDVSTSLSDLNGGSGIPKGKIVISYSSYPDGLEVDLSNCDTLEDVKDRIEQATLEASKNLDPADCSWLDGDTLDWKDLTDRYVKVTLNPDGNGISLQEFDLGESLPEPTAAEMKKGLEYSGAPGYSAGDTGVGAGTVYDKADYIYGDGSATYAPIGVDNCAGNTVAASLGIKGTANAYNPSSPDSALDGFIHGSDLNPAISGSTLLSDLAGYNNAVYTITNGSVPGRVTIMETGSDTGNVFGNWNLSNLSAGYNTGTDGELYARVTRRDDPDNDLYVEIYAVPLDKAKASDLVAAGSCGQSGGTVQLQEANGSGVSGSVGISLPATADSATVNLKADFGSGYQAVVNVPAFVEETDEYGVSLDRLNILSGWSITGLDKPPASGYDLNHPASTDLDGNVTVNLREVNNGDGTSSLVLELYRPAYDDQPSVLIATGELNLGGTPPLSTAASGRIAITGEPGFEGIGGSVYVELPAGESVDSLSYNLTATFATVEDLMRAVEESGVYASVGILENGSGLEFQSQLAGSYLTVSEDSDCYEQMGDVHQQLSGLDLNGMVRGVSADSSGNVYTEVAFYPPDSSRSDGKAVILSESGEQIVIDAGYYVRVYSDSSALDRPYAERDNSSLVAEGFLAAGAWDGTDPENPYVPVPPATSVGSANNLVLVEKNGSGVSGTVDLNYYGGRDQAVPLEDGGYYYDSYNNSSITVSPGGLRGSNTPHTTLQEIDISGFTPGTHCDYSGTAHGVISYDDVSGTTMVSLYRDSSRTHMSAKGELNGETGKLTLYETDKSGNYLLDANGGKIEVGGMVVTGNTLANGQSDTFSITLGGIGASGQDRESNIFSTINDVITALNANDVDALHDLIDVLQGDIDRLLGARADVGARNQRLELLSERYEDDLVSYTAIYESQVGMDTDAMVTAILNYNAAETAYSASLQVAARYLQLSLLDYL